MKQITLQTKIESLPEDLKKEVSDFVDTLLAKKTNARGERKAGFLKGQIKMSDDFDEPLDDFKEYM